MGDSAPGEDPGAGDVHPETRGLFQGRTGSHSQEAPAWPYLSWSPEQAKGLREFCRDFHVLTRNGVPLPRQRTLKGSCVQKPQATSSQLTGPRGSSDSSTIPWKDKSVGTAFCDDVRRMVKLLNSSAVFEASRTFQDPIQRAH